MKTTFKVVIKDTTPALFALLRSSGPEISGYMASAAARTLEKGMVATLKKNKNVFEGNLLKSIKTKITRISGNPKVEVGTFDVEYAKYIEYGRPAGVKFDRKEFGKLMKWVSRKLGQRPPANMLIANKIRRNLTEKGRKAQPFVRTVAQSHERQFTGKLESSIARYVNSIKV